jgi:hypothetical protein
MMMMMVSSFQVEKRKKIEKKKCREGRELTSLLSFLHLG